MHGALQQQQAGNLPAAEAIYRKALATSRDEPDCLHMLGVICYQTGRYVEAARLIWQALQITGWSVDAMKHNLSLVVSRMVDDSATWDAATWDERTAAFAGSPGPTVAASAGDRSHAEAGVAGAIAAPSVREGARVLYVDGCAPQRDRDSASVRLVSILRLLRNIGCSVAFHALDMDYAASRDGWMEDEGIEVLRPP